LFENYEETIARTDSLNQNSNKLIVSKYKLASYSSETTSAIE